MFKASSLQWLLLASAVLVPSVPSSELLGATNEGSAQPVCPPAEVNKDSFAALFEKALHRAGHFEEVFYDKREFRLRWTRSDGAQSYLYLSNAHTDYCKALEEDRVAVVDHYVASLVTQQNTNESIPQESLLPTVRGRAYFEFMDLLQAIDGPEASAGRYHLTLGTDIAVGIASDGETQITHLFDARLADAGLSHDEALRVSINNLRRISTDSWVEMGPSLFRSGWQDDYDPSRLLLPDMIGRLPIKGHPVALAADNNTLLVTGSENKQGLLEMARIGRAVLQNTTRPLSGQAIVLTDDGWVDFTSSDPELRPLVDLQKEQLSTDYEQQKELLERLYEVRQEDVFVASYILVQNEDLENLTSYAVWTKGVTTLLPRTDHIVFVEPETDEQFDAPWAVATAMIGHLMTKTDVYPERYRVDDYPTLAEIEELKRSAGFR